MKRLVSCLLAIVAVADTAVAQQASEPEPITIAHVYDKNGALADYGAQLHRGLTLGFEFATGGTGRVLDRPLVVIGKDSELRPERVRSALAEAYSGDGAVLAVGPLASNLATDAIAVAEEYRKILVFQGVADAITSSEWSRYGFRVARNWSQEAIANAIVAARPGGCIATIAQDYEFGRSGIDAYRSAANKLGAVVFHEEYLDVGGSDFSGAATRVMEALAGRGACREKNVFAIWAGSRHPFDALVEAGAGEAGITLSAGGSVALPEDVYQRYPGLEGATTYHYLSPANEANDWLVMEYFTRFNSPPTAYVAQGMAEAMFIVAALERAGSTDTERLIEAMEGLSFDSPKGRMTMRPEDHQALQPMYHFRMTSVDGLPAVPSLVREIKAREIELPLRNRP